MRNLHLNLEMLWSGVRRAPVGRAVNKLGMDRPVLPTSDAANKPPPTQLISRPTERIDGILIRFLQPVYDLGILSSLSIRGS